MLALAAAPPQPARICLTDPEAQAMVLVAMPDILRETGRLCAARLPEASPFRRADGALIGRYQSTADQAWPAARAAIVKLSDPAADILLQSDYARPLLTSIIVPLIVGRIAVRDCTTIDRLVTNLAPLPPRNIAGIVITTLQYLKRQKAGGKAADVPDLPLCNEDGR
ncbi:hypothetical protein [uncultured Sphingomonas sp.]|uniref:hypothetical protein n=1 Tax=uncultured Sphingomonas sp. TaxID=158754 RepID=UPI0035CBCCF4